MVIGAVVASYSQGEPGPGLYTDTGTSQLAETREQPESATGSMLSTSIHTPLFCVVMVL